MKSNFCFLNRYWPTLANIGAMAEGYLYNDPNSCIYKIGMFAERIVQEIFAFEHIPEPDYDNTHANRIKILKREGIIDRGGRIDDILYSLRMKRNDAVHKYEDSVDIAKSLLRMAFRLAVWFMEVYGDYNFQAPDFVMPENKPVPDYESIIKNLEEQLVNAAKAAPVVTATNGSSSKDRSDKSAEVTGAMELTETETRIIIDDQLRKYGWEVDTKSIRYSNGTRPQKGRNLAIAEFPTNSTVTIANQTNIQTSSTPRRAHGCVVVLDIRQYACVLRLALYSPASSPFVRLCIWIAIRAVLRTTLSL